MCCLNDLEYADGSPNKRSFRGPGGVSRELNSVNAPKSVRRNWPLRHQGGILWPPVVDATDGEDQRDDDDGDDGTDTTGRTDGQTDDSSNVLMGPQDDVSGHSQ